MLNFLVLLGFFNSFISPFGMLSYLCSIKLLKTKFALSDIFFALYIVLFFVSQLLVYNDPVLIGSLFRFYFGFFCFYLFFKSGSEFKFKSILLILIIIVPLEAIMINTVILPQSMPNFPSEDAYSHFNSDGYQRPYSFAGNAAVASGLMVAMLGFLQLPNLFFILTVSCILIFSSGSGLIGLLLLFFLKNIKYLVISLVLFLLLVIVFQSNTIQFLNSLGLKLNSEYVNYLIDFKLDQISDFFEGFTVVNYAFGKADALASGYGGDFAWLYFIIANGLTSFFVVLFFILCKITRETSLSIIIMLLLNLHYPVMFYLPGQILMGYLMSKKYRD